jgi:hypothetical protein
MTKMSQLTKVAELTKVSDMTKMSQLTKVAELTKLTPVSLPKLSKPPPPIPPPGLFDLPKTNKIQFKTPLDKPEPGFNVFLLTRPQRGVKKSGKQSWTKLNKVPLTKSSALSLGSRKADKYVERSFKLTSTKQKASKNIFESGWEFRKNKFRKSKKGNHFVEKTNYAIDSFEEKQGIPYKAMKLREQGLINLSKKKKKRFLF